MTEEVVNAISDRGIIVTRRTTQSFALLEVLNIRLPLICSISDNIDQTIKNALLNDRHKLIMIDAAVYGQEELLRRLKSFGDVIPQRIIAALFNLSSDSEWKVGTIPFGVRAFFGCEDSIDTMIRGLQRVIHGDVWIPRRLLLEVATGNHDGSHGVEPNGSEYKPLTIRESEILSLVCTGASNDEVGSHLNISTNTVKTHLYNIYKKIDVPNRMQAILWGAKNL